MQRMPFFFSVMVAVCLYSVACVATGAPSAALGALTPAYAGRGGCLVVSDCASGAISGADQPLAGRRLPPCSTFKIWNTLIGLETGLLAAAGDLSGAGTASCGSIPPGTGTSPWERHSVSCASPPISGWPADWHAADAALDQPDRVWRPQPVGRDRQLLVAAAGSGDPAREPAGTGAPDARPRPGRGALRRTEPRHPAWHHDCGQNGAGHGVRQDRERARARLVCRICGDPDPPDRLRRDRAGCGTWRDGCPHGVERRCGSVACCSLSVRLFSLWQSIASIQLGGSIEFLLPPGFFCRIRFINVFCQRRV